MCNFQQCATRSKTTLHARKLSSAMGLTMFLWSCEKSSKTLRDEALTNKGCDRVISTTVLADGRCLKAHVPPRTSNGLVKKGYLW